MLILHLNHPQRRKEKEIEASLEAENVDSSEGNPSRSTAPDQAQAEIEPDYVKLWRKTKQHKDGTFDDEGEIKLNEFKRLHKNEIQDNCVDNLSIDEAYMKVLGHCSGYARGLGKGHPIVDKGGKKGKAVLQAEIQQLKGVNDAMRAELVFLKAESQRKEQAALEKQEATERKLELIMQTLGLD